MEQFLFDNLVQSLKEAKAIARGESPASRRIKITPPDVKGVREKIGLSQSEFAQLMHVSIKTLQNWEQHRPHPHRPCCGFAQNCANRTGYSYEDAESILTRGCVWLHFFGTDAQS